MVARHQLTEGEEFVLRFNPHWVQLIFPVFVFVVTLGAAVVLVNVIPANASWANPVKIAIAVAAAIVLFIWALVPFLRWKTTRYVLTTHRFAISTGILSKSDDDIPLTKVNTVKSDQSLLQRMLGSGVLVVESAAEQGAIELKNIPRVQFVRTKLFQLVEDASDGDIDGR